MVTRALISADNHVFEPVTLWQERLPAAFRDRGPRVEQRDDWVVMAIEGMPDRKLTKGTAAEGPNAWSILDLGAFAPVAGQYVHPTQGTSDFGPFPGNMTGRNAFRGPGNWNLDFSILKTFALTERFKLQLRGEAYNIFNHSNLYIVNSNTDVSVYTPSTNYVTAQKGIRQDNLTSTENRNLQLALKLIF